MRIKSIVLTVLLGLSIGALAQNQSNEHREQKFDYYFFESLRLKNIQKYNEQYSMLQMCLNIDSCNSAALSEIGQLYAQMKNFKEAEKYFAKAVKISPENWWYRTQYMQILVLLEKDDVALEEGKELIERFPYKEQGYVILSSLYGVNGKFEEAIKVLNKLEVFTGINENLSFKKMKFYMLLNDKKNATKEIEKLMEKYPLEYRYQVALGDMYFDGGDSKKAYQIYQQILAKDKNNPYIYISLANYYKKNNMQDKAKEIIVEALKNRDIPAAVKMEMLSKYVDSILSDDDNVEDTEKLIKMLVEMYPMEELPHIYYAMFLQDQNRADDALAELESIVNINPKNEDAWKAILKYDADKNDSIAILKNTERALKVLPNVSEFYYFRVIALVQLKRTDDAIETIKNALDNIKNSISNVAISQLYGQLGDLYFLKDDKEKAFEYFDKALLTNPSNAYVLNNYAYYLSLNKEELARAEKMSSKTIDIEPNNSTFLDTYAWILYERKSYDLAKFYIEKAIENIDKNEPSAVIFEHAGDIYSALKQPEKAVEMWKKAIENGGDKAKLQKKIEEIKNR